LQILQGEFPGESPNAKLQPPKGCLPDVVEKVRPAHAGLWLDKYLTCFQPKGESLGRDEIEPRQHVIAEATAIPVSDVYRDFYGRWQATLTALEAVCKLAQAQGRIAIGLGNESTQETAISLHRTYGVPYLPGSALKGLAASFAAKRLGKEWERESEAYRIVFGNTEQAGYITFFDAYPDPESGPLLHPDIMAIHHPDYYQGKGDAPADWDDPNLVPFPTATGRYLVALAGPPGEWAQEWVKTTFLIVGYALEEMGIGAKTSSGYGRMVLEEPSETYEQAKARLLKEQPGVDRKRGLVHKVDGNRGFITSVTGGGSSVYIHQNDLRGGQGTLRNDQVVEFRLAPGKPNPKAVDVVILLQPAG
jgi:CRISPR-associated protein Cmr6